MRLTVIVDRPEGSNAKQAEAAIANVVKALKPLGVRVRVTRAAGTDWVVAGYKAAAQRARNERRTRRR